MSPLIGPYTGWSPYMGPYTGWSPYMVPYMGWSPYMVPYTGGSPYTGWFPYTGSTLLTHGPSGQMSQIVPCTGSSNYLLLQLK